MKQIAEFINEEGFELNGYISELFEQVSDGIEENKADLQNLQISFFVYYSVLFLHLIDLFQNVIDFRVFFRGFINMLP